MTIFGKTISEYIRFQLPVLIFVAVVGLLRLVLSLAGLPNATVKWVSVSVAGLIGVIYYGIRVHTEGFGGFRHLLPLVLIQNVVTQALIISAIALAIVTGQDNIYTAPEYSVDIRSGASGVEGKTWIHAAGHAVFGLVVGSLMMWAIASLILLVTRAVIRGTKPPAPPVELR